MSRNAFGCCAGVDRLLGRLQRDALGLELVHDVLQLLQRARQTIDAGDDERVTGAHEIEQHLQFAAPVAARPTRLLGSDYVITRCFSAACWIARSWSRVKTWA
jgi:hypothetical protein